MSDKQIREEGREMEKGEGEMRTRVGVWRRGGDEEGERERRIGGPNGGRRLTVQCGSERDRIQLQHNHISLNLKLI